MNCHTQIWITSPTLEPCAPASVMTSRFRGRACTICPISFYFNHSIHVNKGVGCESCHGRVDKMPLMSQAHPLLMEWCLNCHRNTEKFIRPRSEITTMGYVPAEDQETMGRRLQKEYNIQDVRLLTSCSTCHR